MSGLLSTQEAADRLAIRELIDAYAFCADSRDADGQKALFTADTYFIVYMQGERSDPTDDLHGRESLTPVFENLNTYELTMVAYLRYRDAIVKDQGSWVFAERRLYLDWAETRELG